MEKNEAAIPGEKKKERKKKKEKLEFVSRETKGSRAENILIRLYFCVT